jgi:hypothetical protein
LREEVVTAVAGRAFWGRSLILLHGLLINMARTRWPYISEASHRGFTIAERHVNWMTSSSATVALAVVGFANCEAAEVNSCSAIQHVYTA